MKAGFFAFRSQNGDGQRVVGVAAEPLGMTNSELASAVMNGFAKSIVGSDAIEVNDASGELRLWKMLA